jgi:hypothetical protein
MVKFVFFLKKIPTLIPLSGVGTTCFSSCCDKDLAKVFATGRLPDVNPPWESSYPKKKFYFLSNANNFLQDYPFNVYLNDKNLVVKESKLTIAPVTLESKYGEDYVSQTLDLTARYNKYLPLTLPP